MAGVLLELSGQFSTTNPVRDQIQPHVIEVDETQETEDTHQETIHKRGSFISNQETKIKKGSWPRQ